MEYILALICQFNLLTIYRLIIRNCQSLYIQILLHFSQSINMKTTNLLLFVLIIYTCFSAKFNIISTSVCSSTSAAGFCTKWQQNGTVQQEIASCFSGSMIVLTKEGYKTFQQLKTEDEILSYDRQRGQIYTKVKGWFHRDSQIVGQYLKMTFDNNEKLIVSEKHNIALQNQQYQFKFVFANQIQESQRLYGKQNSVKKIQIIKEKGMYAPMTRNNNYYVFTSKSSENKKILAHDFAHIRNPEAYESIANMLISVYQSFNGVQYNNAIHPGAQWMMDKFSFILK